MGTRTREAAARGRGAVAVVAVAALSVACASTPAPDDAEGRALAEVHHKIEAALDLYEAGDFALAATRFHEAAEGAKRLDEDELHTYALTSECASWLRSRNLPAFSSCTENLQRLRSRNGRPDPGVNTLLALGAMAGERPLPPYRVPTAVLPYVHETVKESR